jgi:hypothetical protein
VLVHKLTIETYEQDRRWQGHEAALWRLTRDLYATAGLPHPEKAIEIIEPPFWSRFSMRRLFGHIPAPELLPVLLIVKNVCIGVENAPFCTGIFYTEALTRKRAFKKAFRKMTTPENVIRALDCSSRRPLDAVIAVGAPQSRYLELFRFKQSLT